MTRADKAQVLRERFTEKQIGEALVAGHAAATEARVQARAAGRSHASQVQAATYAGNEAAAKVLGLTLEQVKTMFGENPE